MLLSAGGEHHEARVRVLGLEFVQQAVGLGAWAVVVGDSYAIGTVDAATVARLCLLRWGRCLLLRSFLREGLGGDVLDLCAGVIDAMVDFVLDIRAGGHRQLWNLRQLCVSGRWNGSGDEHGEGGGENATHGFPKDEGKWTRCAHDPSACVLRK